MAEPRARDFIPHLYIARRNSPRLVKSGGSMEGGTRVQALTPISVEERKYCCARSIMAEPQKDTKGPGSHPTNREEKKFCNVGIGRN